MSKTGTDIDIYEDIGDFNFEKELRKLEESNKAYSHEVSQLSQKLKEVTDKNEELQRVNDILATNISILLKTAKVEIDRKQLMIESYREDIKNLKKRNNYRRSDVQNSGYSKSEVVNDKEQHTHSYNKHGSEENCQEDYDRGVSNIKTKVRNKSHDRESNGEHSGRHKKKKSRWERSKSRSKDKSSSSRSQSKHSEDNYSHHSSSTRSDHRHHSDDRRHSDRRKRKRSSSRSDRRHSPRSRRSDHSRHRKDEVRRDGRRSSGDKRSTSPSKDAKTSERDETVKTGNSESRARDETEPLTRRRTCETKECQTKDFDDKIKREEVSKPIPNGKEDRSESRSKEKCDVQVKKLNLSEYQGRQGSEVAQKKQSETTLFTRQSVLGELYDEPVTVSRFSKGPRENLEKTQSTSAQRLAVSAYNEEDSSSDDGWDLCFTQNSNPVNKPKTLYTRRMEARLQQKMKEEEIVQKQRCDNPVEESRNMMMPAEGRENHENKKTDLNIVDNSQKEKGCVEGDAPKEDVPADYPVPAPVVGNKKQCADSSLEEGEIVDDVEDAITEIEEKPMDKELDGGLNNDGENGGSKEPTNCEEKVPDSSQKGEERKEESACDITAQKPVLDESLTKACFHIERRQESENNRNEGIQVFTPLKNNYKVWEISPIKPVQKQHILEYYNLKPSAQQEQEEQQHQMKTSEPEGLNFSFPQTPGKNFANSFSIISDFQVLTSGLCDSTEKDKEETSIADPIDVEDDKCAADVLNPEMSHSAEGDTEGVSESPESVTNNKKRTSPLARRRSLRKSGRGRDTSDEGDSKCHTKPEMSMSPRVELVDIAQSKPGVRKSKRTSVRVEEKRDEEQSYQLRTRSQSRTKEEAKKKESSSAKNGGSTRRRNTCKSDSGRRKRKTMTSDDGDGSQEDEAFLRVATKRPKTDKEDAVDDGKLSTERTPSPMKKTKTEEKETGAENTLVSDDVASFQVLQSLTSEVPETPQAELITTTTGLDDLSLSNSGDGQLLGFSSTVITAGASLHDDGVLETPMKILPSQTEGRMNSPVETPVPNETSPDLVGDGQSLNSSFVLRKYLMMSNTEEFSDDSSVDSDGLSVDSDEYSDSGASAFVDLL